MERRQGKKFHVYIIRVERMNQTEDLHNQLETENTAHIHIVPPWWDSNRGSSIRR